MQSPAITSVSRVDLRVDDLDRALALYGDVIGLEVAERDETRAALRAPGGPVLLTLRSDGVARPSPRRATGLFHTAIRFPSRADLAAVLRRLAAARAPLSGASDHGVSEALYLDDPAGNGVELYWDRPREVWPAEMITAPLDLQDVAASGGETPAAPVGTDIGHVHLKVSALDRAQDFYVGELGLDLMHRWDDQASFVAAGGYHHHVGLNVWHSLGARATPADAAGVDRVVFASDGETGTVRDPDGLAVELV